MSDHFCRVCGRMKFSGHICPPAFACRFADLKNHGDEWTVNIRAGDAETAAEKFAEEYDIYNEYSILTQGDRCEEIVEVRDHDGVITRWSIHGESIPHYYAEEADEDETATLPDPPAQR
jgi:hypothetical protein